MSTALYVVRYTASGYLLWNFSRPATWVAKSVFGLVKWMIPYKMQKFGIRLGPFFKLFLHLSYNYLKLKNNETLGDFAEHLAQNWADWHMMGHFSWKLVFVWVYFQVPLQHQARQKKKKKSLSYFPLSWAMFPSNNAGFLQCDDSFPYFFPFFTPNHKISWKGASCLACLSCFLLFVLFFCCLFIFLFIYFLSLASKSTWYMDWCHMIDSMANF